MNTLFAKIITRVFWFIKFKYRFLFNNVSIRGKISSIIIIETGVKLNNVSITVDPGSNLFIANGTHLKNVDLSVNGSAAIGCNNLIRSHKELDRLYIDVHGKLIVGSNNRLETNIRVRFNGNLSIGNFTNINTSSEIRCDDKVIIGDFNQISYNVVIWDTNTHNIYTAAERRSLTVAKGIGFEYEKPKTKPVYIGDDCWIGRDVAILKGVTIENKCIVGYRSLLTDVIVKENTTVVSDINLKMFDNKI